MTNYGKGWVLFIAAIGMMFTLMSAEITSLSDWHNAGTPGFIGKVIAHLGVVIAAFVGGKLIPTEDK